MSKYTYSSHKGLISKSRVRFKTVWVIDSLPSEELQTAKELFDDTITYQNIREPGFNRQYSKVYNKSQLFESLDHVFKDLRDTGEIPLLHIECHGSPEGIRLACGDLMPYEELFPALSKINVATQNNLLIVVAACHGMYMTKVIIEAKRAPFWGILGPSKELTANEVLSANHAFYNSLLQGESLDVALISLRTAVPSLAEIYAVLTSEHLFLIGFRSYIDEQCTGPGLDERIQRLVQKAQEKEGIDIVEATRFAEEQRKNISSERGQKEAFDRLSREFFLHDLFPENRDLPSPTFEQVLQVRRQ